MGHEFVDNKFRGSGTILEEKNPWSMKKLSNF